MRHPLLLVPVLVAAGLSLAGCFPLGGGTTDPMNDAYRFCEAQIAPMFDNPTTVVWNDDREGGPNASGGFDWTLHATADDAAGTSETYTVLCTVTGTRPDFTLATFDIVDTGPAN
jgi:hypothetical protein